MPKSALPVRMMELTGGSSSQPIRLSGPSQVNGMLTPATNLMSYSTVENGSSGTMVGELSSNKLAWPLMKVEILDFDAPAQRPSRGLARILAPENGQQCLQPSSLCCALGL